MKQDASTSELVASSVLRKIRDLEARPGDACSDSTRRLLLDAATDQQAELQRWQRRLSRRASSDTAEDVARRRFVQQLCTHFDHERHRQIQRRLLTTASIEAHGGWLKYLNLTHWLRVKLDLALELGLHLAKRRSILDLGVGAGHFPFVCRHFGHQTLGTDIEPLPLFAAWEDQHLYDALLELFEVEKIPLTVERRRRLPDLGRRFDLVTALMIKFDNPRPRVVWSVDDWLFFLSDIAARYTTPNGRIFLTLNRPFATPEILRAMADAGAAIDERKCAVRFESLDGLR